MQTIDELIKSLDRVSPRYEKLKSHFLRFSTHLITLTNVKFPIPGISITNGVDNNKTIINFAGKEIIICFTAFYQNDTISMGRVSSFVKNKFTEDGLTMFDEFDFGSDAKTNHEIGNDEDPLYINADTHAYRIALDIIKKSLTIE